MPMTGTPTNISQDASVKASAMSLLWGLGYVVRPELILSEPRARTTTRRAGYLDLTDVDVQGYTFSPLLKMQMVAVDCGTGKHRAAMDRVFWCRGLMEATGLEQSVCVVGRNTEEEHRLAANKLDVILVSTAEFQALAGSLLGRNGGPDLAPYYRANTDWLKWLAQSQTPFAGYLLRENWTREWDRLPVALPIQLKRWGVKFNPSMELHQFTFFEVALLLALGLVRMGAYLTLARPDDFAGAVYSYVLGGGRRAGLFRSLIQRVENVGLQSRDEQPRQDKPNLEVNSQQADIPHFTELLDLTQRLVTRAGAARHVPRYIQALQLARLNGSIQDYPAYLTEAPDAIVLKLSVDVLRYLRLTGGYPPEASQIFDNV